MSYIYHIHVYHSIGSTGCPTNMSTLYFSTILWPVIISANISYIVCMHLLGLAGFETFLYLGFWPARSVATFCMSSYLLAGFKP